MLHFLFVADNTESLDETDPVAALMMHDLIAQSAGD